MTRWILNSVSVQVDDIARLCRGKRILFLGRSRTGKTCLTRCLEDAYGEEWEFSRNYFEGVEMLFELLPGNARARMVRECDVPKQCILVENYLTVDKHAFVDQIFDEIWTFKKHDVWAANIETEMTLHGRIEKRCALKRKLAFKARLVYALLCIYRESRERMYLARSEETEGEGPA